MVRFSRIGIVGVVALVAGVAGRAEAGFTATAQLGGAQEVPPVATGAVGSATVVYDDAAGTLTVDVSYYGLSAPPSAAHIHVGAFGTNGPVIFNFPNLPPGTAGTYQVVLDAGDLIPRPAVGINTFQNAIDAIEAGNAYVNMHNRVHPGGEIRGQLGVLSVPAPAGVVLAAVGAVGLLAARLRRRPTAA